MSWNVDIEICSDGLVLSPSERRKVEGRIASSLSRYSDRLIAVEMGVRVSRFPDGSEEFLCEVACSLEGCRRIQVTTRATSLEEVVARASDRAARSADRVIRETAVT